MIAILQDHLAQIILPVAVKFQGIAVLPGGLAPVVKGLVHDVHPQLVASPEHALTDGVVGAADGVEAGLLQDPHLAVGRCFKIAGAEDAVVMVDAAPAQERALSVDGEAGFGAPGQLADAEGDLLFIKDFAVLRERNNSLVQMGMLLAPQLGIGNREQTVAAASLGHFAVTVKDGYPDLALAFDLRLHTDLGGGDALGDDLHTVERDVTAAPYMEPDRAIDAVAGIPAGVGYLTAMDVHQ